MTHDMNWLIGMLGGAAVGLMLGLVGGGGSILAMPIMVHGLGVGSTHVAIGTTAVAVTVNALAGLALSARQGLVKWRCASVLALAGSAGAGFGAWLGQRVEGAHLLSLFGVLMLAVGALMLRPRAYAGDPLVRLTRSSAMYLAPRLLGLGLLTGIAAGFFGIGGGFLIVPALLHATGMPILMAVASSLVAVAAFGLTTAASYALAGMVDWPLAGLFILGGVVGSLAGARLATRLATHKNLLAQAFGALVIVMGIYIILAD